MEIRRQMLFRYVVTLIKNPQLYDVRPHVHADVCPVPNLVQIESPVPTITPQISSFLHTIGRPKAPLRILRSQIQPNIKPHFLTFSIAHSIRRKRQRPPSSRVIESPRHSTFSAALYMTRLGLPINASDFWVIRHEFEFSELLLPY